MSMLDHTLKSEAVRRVGVITGTGRRRRFSEDYKAQIVEETLAPGAVVSQVARRHGLSPQQLFGWRRQARQPLEAVAGEDAPLFVPVVVDFSITGAGSVSPGSRPDAAGGVFRRGVPTPIGAASI